ncbi:metallophosphoesterase [Caballeronia sp. LZ043]|uniref:metallophosphoesterase n=1 Tax=Caballeronia sp. LZ043 TaxID=3038569 RepID=UPI00285B8282|nr:metallophosphoesterase [Caballeronia sp. LZ043]MDR5824726.1 metallophosphoesterase [Caballeronia sp. LZ043]
MSFVQRFTRNTCGRDFAVGDIHGHFTLLQRRLEEIGFDAGQDRLFSVGDLVDRGPESDDALDWIDHPWFHAVRGNHEDMAIRWPSGNMDRANYAANGGSWNITNPRAHQLAVSSALGALPIAIEVETETGLVGIVHADCPRPTWSEFTAELVDPDLANSRRRALFEHALWSRDRIQGEDHTSVPDVRAVIVGHTPLKRPAVLGNVHFIDTGGWYRDGYFTLIDLATLETMPPTPKKLEWQDA